MKDWANIELVLKQEIFREDLRKNIEKGDERHADIDNLCSKLVVGALGFLWCKGSKEDKAEFFFDLCVIPTSKRNRKQLEDKAT